MRQSVSVPCVDMIMARNAVSRHRVYTRHSGQSLEIWPQPSLSHQHLEHLCHIYTGQTQVKGDIKKLMMLERYQRPYRLDESDYFPIIKYVQLCFFNFTIMCPQLIGLMRFCYTFQASEFKISWGWVYFVLNIHWFQTGTFEELIWVCEESPGPLVMVQPG